MKALIQAELLKLRTVRTVGWTVAATLAFVPLSIVLAITRPDAANSGGLDSTEGFRNVIAGASSGGVLMIVIGIIAMAGEFRFNTVTSVFLVTPDRRSVVGAKLASTALTGLAVGIASSLLTLAIALPWLSSRNVDVSSHLGDIVDRDPGRCRLHSNRRTSGCRHRVHPHEPDPRDYWHARVGLRGRDHAYRFPSRARQMVSWRNSKRDERRRISW